MKPYGYLAFLFVQYIPVHSRLLPIYQLKLRAVSYRQGGKIYGMDGGEDVYSVTLLTRHNPII